jgi:hypothetical protein
MKKAHRINAVVVGLLFIVTMLLGMIDANFVAPSLDVHLSSLYQIQSTILLGVFSVFFMAIGIVGIATTLFPVVRRQSEAIAITYVSFRIVECFLLTFGAILYLFLLTTSKVNFDSNFLVGNLDTELPKIAVNIKLDTYQLGMVVLGIGSILLCYSFYKSQVIPRWLSVWGLVGYLLLFLSAVFALLGIVDTVNGIGALMYIPGGLWELFAFPIWLFVKGFNTSLEQK